MDNGVLDDEGDPVSGCHELGYPVGKFAGLRELEADEVPYLLEVIAVEVDLKLKFKPASLGCSPVVANAFDGSACVLDEGVVELLEQVFSFFLGIHGCDCLVEYTVLASGG